jgi:ParB-like chromosome segregation protein Spo0J
MGRSVRLTLHTGAARPLPADWRLLLEKLPEDLRDLYEERAALIEHDGGEKRKTAERRAFECVMRESEAAAALLGEISARRKQGAGAFSSEVDTGSREENASRQKTGAPIRFPRSGKGSGENRARMS